MARRPLNHVPAGSTMLGWGNAGALAYSKPNRRREEAEPEPEPEPGVPGSPLGITLLFTKAS
jgi:hypothetical protein